MLEDAGGIRRVILACGFVDLRKGIDGLAQVIGSQVGAGFDAYLCSRFAYRYRNGSCERSQAFVPGKDPSQAFLQKGRGRKT